MTLFITAIPFKDLHLLYAEADLGLFASSCENMPNNVMCSRGSVIPLFIQQIHADKPITITDPSMTRFMMTLDDAVDLVLYAFEHGKPGEIFVRKAPAATIETLTYALTNLLGTCKR